MKHLKLFEAYNTDMLAAGFAYHMLMVKDPETVYADSFDSFDNANEYIKKYMERGYKVAYFGKSYDAVKEEIETWRQSPKLRNVNDKLGAVE